MAAGLATSLAVVAASFATAPGAGAANPAGPTATGPAAQTVATGAAAATAEAVEITLITGDKVRYQAGPDGQAQVTVVEAVSTTFRGEEPPGGGVYLYPDVVEPYVASGVLDRELFNIEYLATHGYDDAHMPQLPLIVGYADAGAPPAAAARASSDAADLAGGRTGPVLESIGAVGVSMDKAQADRFWESLASQASAPEASAGGTSALQASGARGSLAAGGLGGAVERVWLDRKMSVTLEESVPLIGAPQAWDAGYDGTGVTVAVLDTGIDATHPDLEGTVVAAKSFVSDTPDDGHGHGTHVASTIAGAGAASGGQYKGVAPGVDLVVGKVLSDEGSGSMAQIIEGMEWAAQEQGADVVSMSLGCGPPNCVSDGTDPVSLAVNNLTASTGALFVVAAGNDGPNPGTVGTPGAADAALTVAASNEGDILDPIASFSSRGPRVDGALKPDIAAPGVHITAARAAGTSLCETGCVQPDDGPVNDFYTNASGTSMATPHVAGAAAILAQQHPDWTAEQLKTTLMSTSFGLTSLFGLLPPPSAYAQGAGRVDIARAVSQQLRTDTPNISPGIIEPGAPAITVPVTFTNDSISDLTVSVDADLRGPTGQPAAEGVISLDRDSVTVPAGGTARVVVTLDPAAAAGRIGSYQGVVTATTDSGDSLRTPVGFTILPPRSKLTIRLVKPAPASELGYFTRGAPWWVVRVDDQEMPWVADDTVWRDTDDPQVMEGTTLVPDGIYSIHGYPNWAQTSGRQMRHLAKIIEPEVTVDGDTIITIDMRDLVPVTVSADKPTEPVWRVSGDDRPTEAGRGVASWTLFGMPDAYQLWRNPTGPVTLGELWVREGYMLAQPDVQLELRAGGRHLTLQPAYPDYPASREDRYPKFTRDTKTVLVTEADLKGGGDVQDALVLVDLPYADNDPAGWEQCPDRPERSTMCTVVNRAREAAEAGAVGVLLTTPRIPLQAFGFLNSDHYLSLLPVPVAWLDSPQADQLADLLQTGRRVNVRIDATVDPSYEYKVWFRETGQVPADLTYQLDSRDMKRVDAAYHGPQPTEPGLNNAGETMHALWPGEFVSFASVRWFDAPTSRVEYYLPTGPEAILDLGLYREDRGTLKSGHNSRTIVGTGPETIDWGPVATPGQVLLDDVTRDDTAFGICAVCRQGDHLWVLPSPTLGDRRQNWSTGYDTSTRLFDADGTEITGVSTWQFVLPPEGGRYRLEHVQTDQASDTLYGRQVHTVWEFTATARPTVNEVEFPYNKPSIGDPAPAAWQPVIFLNYDIPLALDNTARAGRPIFFRVKAAAGQPGSGADIRGLELEASFDDGQTWTDARVIRPLGDGKFWVMVKHPKLSQTTGAVTLRAHAWDDAGNEVTQTIERAYGLR